MRDRIWKGYLLFGGGGLAVFLLIPPDGWLNVFWSVAIGYLATAAIIVGVRLNQPAGRITWYCFAAAVFGNSSGILAEAVVLRSLGVVPLPSVADVFYLSLYPAAAVGLALLIRRRSSRRDWGALVDATTVTIGMGLLAWVFMIQPVTMDPSLGVLGGTVSAAYPVGDVVLLAMTVRLMVGSGLRNPAYRLMSGSLMLFLAGDTAWAVINRMGVELGPLALSFMHVNFLAAYLVFGAAALHRSVRDLGHRDRPRPPQLSKALLTTLTVASLIAPALLMWQVSEHLVTDGLAISLGCMALFLLVVTRMAQLLRQLERQSAKVRQLSRTDDLTGLPNRRAWTGELPRAIERARRDRVALSIAMIDLDHFKMFNDSYGHPAGDRLLKAAGAAWREQLRAVDHLARYGGEEFIVLLPDAGTGEAVEVLNRLRTSTPLGQSCSAGLATWDGAETSDELVGRADRALYEAKERGRDRVVVAGVMAVA